MKVEEQPEADQGEKAKRANTLAATTARGFSPTSAGRRSAPEKVKAIFAVSDPTAQEEGTEHILHRSKQARSGQPIRRSAFQRFRMRYRVDS